MANYTTTITNVGAALLASVIANQGTLTFNEFRFSENDYTGQESTLTEGTFLGVFITASAAASVIDSTTIKTSAQFNNSTITGNHNLYSIGIVGTDGNTTALIAVCTTTDPDVIREPLTGTSTYAFNVNLSVSDTSQITVAGTTAAVLYDIDVVDTLISTATDKPLSANQGRVLNEKVESLTNPYLIDNPWFTVNQRGWTSGVGIYNQYCVDRWKMTYGNVIGTIAVTANGLHITPDTVGDRTTLFQPLESDVYTKLNGKTLTFSALMSDGTIYSGTETLDTSNDITFYEDTKIRLMWHSGYKAVRIDALDEITIRAVKFEVGKVSTLHLDVAPNDAIELAKCRASTADPSDTYANKGNLVNYADLTSLYLTGSTNTTGSTINAGTYFYLNGSYCKAKTSIANGATFTLNTNYEEVTVGGELNNKADKWTLVATATGDGVKTISQVISELTANYDWGEFYKYRIVYNDEGAFYPMNKYSFVQVDASNTGYATVYFRMINTDTNSQYEANGTFTPTDYSTSVLPSGYTYKLYKIG